MIKTLRLTPRNHAGQYALRDVSYAGFQWRASSGGGWTKDKGASATAVLAT